MMSQPLSKPDMKVHGSGSAYQIELEFSLFWALPKGPRHERQGFASEDHGLGQVLHLPGRGLRG